MQAFAALILTGGEVTAVGLDARIKNAKALVLLSQDKCLKGIAAVENPEQNYKSGVFQKAQATVQANEFLFELGWLFVLPRSRGAGFSHKLVQAALGVTDGRAVFATSRSDNAPMHKVLNAHGFFKDGKAYASSRCNQSLELFISAQEANVTSFKSAVSQADSKMSTIRSGYRAQLETERAELLFQVNKLKGDIGKSALRNEAHNIYSPHSGIVKDLTVTSRGAVVAVGTTLMMIVPKEDPLQAEVSLRNEDISFIDVGAPVKIEVATYPFQKYGLLDGKVVSISADSVDSKQAALNGVPQLTYKAIVSLATQTLESKAQAASLGLSSGMLIAAEIHLNRRTVLEYLISPVQKLAAEAARKR